MSAKEDIQSRLDDNMSLANNVLSEVENLFPHGAANRQSSARSSDAEGLARFWMREQEENYSVQNPYYDFGETAVKYQGAVCHDMAAVAAGLLLNKMGTQDPVLIVNLRGEDHTVVLLGDPDEVGKKRSIVLDPWRELGAQTVKDYDWHLDTSTARRYDPSEETGVSYYRLSNMDTISRGEVDEFMENSGVGEVGRELYKEAKHNGSLMNDDFQETKSKRTSDSAHASDAE